MLPDYKQLAFTPLKFRHVHFVLVQATFGSGNGTATKDAANSSPQTTFTGSAGTYTLTLPRGQFIHVVGAEYGNNDATPGASEGISFIVDNSSIAPANGTFTVIATAGGAPVTPPDGSRCYMTVLVGRA